ncbi:SWPV1-187 [Shearwaterpox virus]|uniref:SWPV1-187 n=1 Tax=Shearwaterpox virus TaxID=1974596 RepID=A0A1V0QGW1_CNPV|nr:SWPV1-187 [Shearwaterpox virus]
MYHNYYNIVSDIDDDFNYIYYGKLKIIVMKQCGYFNATKVCKHFNKEFHKWQRFESSKSLMVLIEKVIFPNKCVINIPSESSDKDCTSGTYVHPLLFPHVLSWISPKYAIQISNIVNCIHTRMYYMKKIN